MPLHDHQPRFLVRLSRRLCATALLAGCSVIACVPVAGAPAIYTAARAAPAAIAASAPSGLTPAQLHSAYSLPNTGPRGQTIAIVAAYDDRYLQSDLHAYTRRFHLPACTTANRCLRELNARGAAAPLPTQDPTGGTWNIEHALGAEVVRAVCQSCSILLVEADSDSEFDLSTAVGAAARAGARVIVTTFVPSESYQGLQYQSDYTHPRAAVVAATGDGGYTGAGNFPATFPDVIAVGGTHLELSRKGRYLGETAWRFGASGCSGYIAAPSWQATLSKAVGCSGKRAVADIAAVADPGALVRITGAGEPGGPWYEVGGTSLAAPIIGGVIGLAGGGGSFNSKTLYQHARSEPRALHDVRSGSNGAGCKTGPICTARAGYDGPTGLGTPNGLAAFKPSR